MDNKTNFTYRSSSGLMILVMQIDCLYLER